MRPNKHSSEHDQSPFSAAKYIYQDIRSSFGELFCMTPEVLICPFCVMKLKETLINTLLVSFSTCWKWMCWAEGPEDTNLMISVVYPRDGEQGAETVLGESS